MKGKIDFKANFNDIVRLTKRQDIPPIYILYDEEECMMMKSRMMKAAVLTGPRQVVLKEVAVPDVHPGEIEIAVSSCGVVTDPGDSSFERHRKKLSARSNASADRELCIIIEKMFHVKHIGV